MTPQLISCDEAGFTGPNLLDENQPVFAYTAVDLTPDEAQAIVDDIRRRHRVQAPELKAQLLRKRGNWSEIALEVAGRVEGRAKIMVCDKRLNLGGKAFEYIFEPVLARNNALFYRHNLHRLTMNALYRAMYAAGAPPHAMAQELERFMRSFDPNDAPLLFSGRTTGDVSSTVLECVLRFARGYAPTIAAATSQLQAGEGLVGKWALDLTSTALFSLLFRGWGLQHGRIDVLCDDSKPLRAQAAFFDGWVSRDDAPEITNGRELSSIRCNLANPLRFGSSADHPTIQVADVLSGAAADYVRAPDDPGFVDWKPFYERHLHPDHLLPDDETIDMRRQMPLVNLTVLRELARRADLGVDPLEGMEAFYRETIDKLRAPAARMRARRSLQRGKARA